MSVAMVDAPHPATIDPETLNEACSLRTQKRSGPGGQHRNKTSSGVFLTHEPSGVVAEATERRSQAENRTIAFQRMRYRLAIELRTPSPIGVEVSPCDPMEARWRDQFDGGPLKLAESNPAKPAVLALLLNDLHAAGGQPSLVAKQWRVSTSSIVALAKSYPPALQLLNSIRSHHGRRGVR